MDTSELSAPATPPAGRGQGEDRGTSATEALDAQALEEQVGHLVLALEHRTVIGQATGILMERYQVTGDTAFATLLRVSSEKNRKVYDLAQDLVTQGRVAGL